MLPRRDALRLIAAALLAGMLAAPRARASWPARPAPPDAPARTVRDASDLLRPVLDAHRVPALAAVLFDVRGPLARAVVGTRRAGHDLPAQPADLWQVASCTKAMVAHLAADLIRDAAPPRAPLRWDATLADLLPDLVDVPADGRDLRAAMRPEYRDATLLDVLTHRAAIQPYREVGEMMPLIPYGPGRDARRLAALAILAAPPSGRVRAEPRYSNGGYVVAAHALETALDEPWEDLMQRRVFAALGMTSARWGMPATAADPDQPWGHLAGAPRDPMPPGHLMSAPPIMRPAGGVSCTIDDFARFARDHLAGLALAAGDEPDPAPDPAPYPTPALSADCYRTLHTPVPDARGFALGWSVRPRPAHFATADEPIHFFYGSPLSFFSLMALAPRRGMGVVACTNSGAGEAACDDAAKALFALGAQLTPAP